VSCGGLWHPVASYGHWTDRVSTLVAVIMTEESTGGRSADDRGCD